MPKAKRTTKTMLMTQYKDSHINAHLGRVNIYTQTNGVIITQKLNGQENLICLSAEDMGKLGRALLAKQRESFPDSLPPKKAAPPKRPVSSSVTAGTSNVASVYARAYAPWTTEEENTLREYCKQGKTVAEISALMSRNDGAIQSRKKKIGLE